MTFTHDDIRDRLIEFLYGDLEGDARTAFEAHVAMCEGCRAEVAQFQNTRAVARAAVRAGLEDGPPAGVRARILEAAAAAKVAAAATAAAPGVRPAAGATKPLPLKNESKSEGETGGPFAWLRARWAVPMFVTVAAMGALLLVRETIYREARKPLGDSPAAPVTAPAPAEPSPVPRGSSVLGQSRPPAEPESPKAEPAEMPRQVVRESAKAERRRTAIEKGVGGGAPRSAPADRPAPLGKASRKNAPAASDRLEDLVSGSETRQPAKRDVNDDLLGGLADKSSTRGFAQPPPPRAAAAPRPAVPVAPAAPPAPSTHSVVMDSDGAAERPQRAPELQKKRATAATEEAEEAAAVPQAAAVSAHSDGDGERAQPDAAATLAARAEKLMAARQWAEAAAAYRQLIARFPKHEQVPNWRRRLAVVEAAAARAAPASK